MRKKLLSIQNMRTMTMDETLRKHNSNTDKKYEIITMSEYQQKLQQLLQKLTIQTKYTNRVTQNNLKNIEQLEQVKQQLNHLLQLRKMEQNNQVMLKNLSNQLAQTLNQTREKLLLVTNQLFQVKKQLKSTKKQMIQLKKINQKLQNQLKKSQLSKYHSMIELYDKQDNKLISTLIQDYIKQIKHPSSLILYKHCVQTLRNKSFNSFLKGLETKMNSLQIQNKDTLRLKQTDQLNNVIVKRKLSNLQLPTTGISTKNISKPKYSQRNFKLPSFRMKTSGSASQPKYSLS